MGSSAADEGLKYHRMETLNPLKVYLTEELYTTVSNFILQYLPAPIAAALDLLLSLDELHLKLFFLRNAKLMGVSLSSLNTNTLAHVLQVSLPEAKLESIEPFSEMLLL
ncbi:hypothetical protein JOQ06_025616, partial [Pogonophryne albipinna]